MLMTEMVLGAPFRHEWSGVVIDPPPGWRMEVRHGFVPYYYLRLQVAKEDEEEALRRWKARSDDDEAYEAELTDLAQGQTCSIKFSDVQENEQSWETKYNIVSTERVVIGATVQVTLIGDAKAAPDRRTVEILLTSPRSSVSIHCEASQARFEKLQPEFAKIVRGIKLPE